MGRRPERVNERHLRRSDHFFQVRGPVSGAPAREAGEVGAIPTHLTIATKTNQQSRLPVEQEIAGAAPAGRATFPSIVQEIGRGPAKPEIQVRVLVEGPLSGDGETAIMTGLHPVVPGATKRSVDGPTGGRARQR